LAILGGLREDLSASVARLEQLPEPDKPEPKLTSGLIPVAEKLIESLDEPQLDLARKYSAQLAAQIHAQHELYLRRELESGTGDAALDKFFSLSRRLDSSLRKGDVADAAVLASEVQGAQNAIGSEKRLPASVKSRNIYNINDALGRAAFLARNYIGAGDYLLKAADTPGTDPSLRTFGPDLWLARVLLNVGYKEVVLAFLERCRMFWDSSKLDNWILTIQEGQPADFGPNIFSKDPILSH
jgi:hypothetical protein